MALNSESRKKKSKKYVGNCPSAIYLTVPNQYRKITFTQLNPDEPSHDKAIIGKIYHVNPIGKRVNGHIRKLLVIDALEEEKGEQKKLTIFLLDQFAEDSSAAEVEGYIMIANFLVEKSTHHKDNEFPFQILVKKENSQIWFGRKVDPSQSKNRNKVKKSKKQNGIAEVEIPSEPVVLSNHYEYVPLGELHESQSKETFNVYGIVEKCDLRVAGTGKQILDLVLADKTEIGFSCSIFSGKDEPFPDIYPGDIIRIHRMLVLKFRHKLKGNCTSSNFILVFSKSNDGTKPRTVAKSFTFTPEDTLVVRDLFEWYEKKNQPKLISEIERGDFVNILCQVIGVYIAKKTDAVILKIWDGTKSNLIESRHWGFRDEKLDEKLFNFAKGYYVVLSVYGQHAATAGELKPGQFIEVRDANLYSPKNNPDDCKLSLHAGNKDKRGIQVLNLDDNQLTELKERLGKIIADAQEFGNQTEDMLNKDNSIFLNCDISVMASSQISNRNAKESTNIDASNNTSPSREENVMPSNETNDVDLLNQPMSSRGETAQSSQDPNVVSVTEAAVKPGQSTQEFGEGMQKEYQQINFVEDNEYSTAIEPDPVLNKTPVEFRMFLHNPSSQSSSSVRPFIHDTPEDWWTHLPAISMTEGHSSVKPSSLVKVIEHEVPYKFRVFCAVLSFKPNINSILQLIHLYCPNCLYMTKDSQPLIEPFMDHDGLFYFYCPKCSNECEHQNRPILKYTYVISFNLHDGTGPAGLEAHLWREDAVKFFKDVSPEQALRNATLADSVLHMLWSICPNCRPFNSRDTLISSYNAYPILDCCIMSYKISDQTVYQIFDTKLL